MHRIDKQMLRHLMIVGLFFLLPACSKIECSQKRHRAITFLNQGVDAFQKGMHEEALRKLKRAVNEDDSYVKAHETLANVYMAMGKWEDGARHTLRVTTMEPKNMRAHYVLGIFYLKLKRYDMARRSFNKALALNPKHFHSHFRLGLIAQAEDQPKEADRHYRKAIQINARFDKPFVKLGLLYLEYDYADLALSVMKSAIAINPTSAESFNILGVAYQQLKEYEKAADAFSKALALKGNLYTAMYNRGMALAAAGKNKAAEKALRLFIRSARNKKSIDQDYVKGAQDKISEIYGQTLGGRSTPPKKPK